MSVIKRFNIKPTASLPYSSVLPPSSSLWLLPSLRLPSLRAEFKGHANSNHQALAAECLEDGMHLPLYQVSVAGAFLNSIIMQKSKTHNSLKYNKLYKVTLYLLCLVPYSYLYFQYYHHFSYQINLRVSPGFSNLFTTSLGLTGSLILVV